MNVVFNQSFGPISEKIIEDYEKKHDLRFPDDYRLFLKKYNGGDRPEKRFVPYHRKDEIEYTMLRCLWGIIKNNENTYVPEEDPAFPPLCDIFPIGADAGNSDFVISLKKEDYGHVYFWCEDYISDYNQYQEGTFFIASSFTEFLNRCLTPDEFHKLNHD